MKKFISLLIIWLFILSCSNSEVERKINYNNDLVSLVFGADSLKTYAVQIINDTIFKPEELNAILQNVKKSIDSMINDFQQITELEKDFSFYKNTKIYLEKIKLLIYNDLPKLYNAKLKEQYYDTLQQLTENQLNEYSSILQQIDSLRNVFKQADQLYDSVVSAEIKFLKNNNLTIKKD